MKSFSLRVSSLLGAALFLLCVWGYFEIAEDYPEGAYKVFDASILRALRTPDNLAEPVGPGWLPSAVRDVSALGSGVILTLITIGTAGYLLLVGRWRNGLAVVLAYAGGELLNVGLKSIAARPRPEIVPHLIEVTSTSFPSGHSMLSAIVYLSVGAVLAKNSHGRKTSAYILSLAVLLTLLAGCSRIYLGVHYPSDVIAGWIAGTAWALFCVASQTWFERRAGRVSGHDPA